MIGRGVHLCFFNLSLSFNGLGYLLRRLLSSGSLNLKELFNLHKSIICVVDNEVNKTLRCNNS